MENFAEKAQFIWSVADLLRGDYKQSEYGRVILPLTVLRRLDQVLAPSKAKVLEVAKKRKGSAGMDKLLQNASGHNFYNTSQYTFETLIQDPNGIALNLRNHINGYSENARKIIEEFRFEEQIDRLSESRMVYKVVKKFSEIDLHPDRVTNREMGYIFEELIRKFSEVSNEEAGHHFTPRDVVRLMVNILLTPDDDAIQKKGIIRTLYDPACGTGGMLSVAEEHIHEMNNKAELVLFGQELNDSSWAVCVSDMLMTGHDPDRIKLGDSFNDDQLKGQRFDYMLCNPPFGVEWKKYEEGIRAEHEKDGQSGRFGAGLPRINDGSFLFLQHMLSKMKPLKEGGSRIGVVFNASPLFTGDAGSGESEIRRWILENDWLEAIIALPEEMFYNTALPTFLWFLSNRKPQERRGRVQLIDARQQYRKMRRGLGEKRNEIGDDECATITRLYGNFREAETSRIVSVKSLGYRRVVVESPRLRRYRSPADPQAAAREIGQPMLASLAPALEWQSRLEAEGSLRGLAKKSGTNLTKKWLNDVLEFLSEDDPRGVPEVDSDGLPVADAKKRVYERVPLDIEPDSFLRNVVHPYAPGAWISQEVRDEVDGKTGKVGYEIPFASYFIPLVAPRPVAEIDRILRDSIDQVDKIVGDVVRHDE